METLNINAVEMVNNTVKLNNTVMGNIEELTKVFEQEEKELNRLVKRNRNEAVIAAQQKVVDEAKNQMEQAKEFERISKEKAVNSSFTFSVVDEETGARTEQQKKIAFVKNNRPVNSKKVDGFIALIAANKYDKAFPIIVMEASKLIEAGYTVTDINGKELTKEEAKDYFVILDGQHRSTAFAKLIATGKYQNLIPNVHVRDIENVGDYWWLPLPILQNTILIAVNQPLADFCFVTQNQRGTKTGQNHGKIKSRTLRPKYPLWNTSVSFAKVQICPLKNEGKSLFLSFTTHFPTIVPQMWLLQTVLTSNSMTCENRVLNFVLHSDGHFQKRELAIEPNICHPYCPIFGFVIV